MPCKCYGPVTPVTPVTPITLLTLVTLITLVTRSHPFRNLSGFHSDPFRNTTPDSSPRPCSPLSLVAPISNLPHRLPAIIPLSATLSISTLNLCFDLISLSSIHISFLHHCLVLISTLFLCPTMPYFCPLVSTFPSYPDSTLWLNSTPPVRYLPRLKNRLRF
jgi:hypothetical protein